MSFYVYRYKNINNEIIYVGQTVRLKERVKQHKSDSWNSETYLIEYIELPNQTQMNQYENYYINLYRPKYNISSVYDGVPIALPKCEWKVFYCSKEKESFALSNLKIITSFYNELNNEIFGGIVSAQISLDENTLKGKITGYCGFNPNAFTLINNKPVYHLVLPTQLFIQNSFLFTTYLLVRMIDIIGLEKGLKTCSRAYTYHNSVFKMLCQTYDLETEYNENHGYYISKLPKYVESIIPKIKLEDVREFQRNKKSKINQIKYVNDTGESVRATKPHILFCLDDNPDIADEIERKYNIMRMQEVIKV